MKYFEKIKKSQVKIDQKFGNLTVCSETYYKDSPKSGKHRRQHVDCRCDCGNIKEGIFCRSLIKGGGVLLYCGINCPFYLEALPKNVPEDHKLCKIGEKYNYLTVISDTFYDQLKGEVNRHKCVKVLCDCGKEKIYREDKVFKGSYKSCGCIWEYAGKIKSWEHIKRTYKLSEEQYYEILKSQNNCCAICESKDNKSKNSEHMFVDHCHDTKKIRGLLCRNCNLGLGLFEDNVEFFKSAIEYLVRNKGIEPIVVLPSF